MPKHSVVGTKVSNEHEISPPTMLPSSKRKAEGKQCFCGNSFTNAKAYGHHVSRCISYHQQLSTRRLHHAAASAALQRTTTTNSLEDPSLTKQRRMLMMTTPQQSSDIRLAEQQRHHQAMYELQMKQIANAVTDSAEDKDDGRSWLFESDNDCCVDVYEQEEEFEGTATNNTTGDCGKDLGESAKIQPHKLPHQPTFPIRTSYEREDTIQFTGTVAPSVEAGIKLMEVLGKHTTDLKLYDDIVNFISDLAESNYNFRHKLPNRRALHKTCETTFEYQSLKPKLVEVRVATMPVPTVQVPVFDVQAVLTKMLTNPSLMQPKHFAANYDIFTGTNTTTNEGHDRGGYYYDEFHTGERWKPAVDHYCDITEKHFPCALVAFYDKSHSDRHGSLAVSPFMFTLTLFNKAARAQSQFWDVLAYIPNLDSGTNKTTDSSIATATTPELKCQDEHNCLFAALRQLHDVNQNGGIPMQVLGKCVKVKVWIHVVVGDISGNNALLGSYNSANAQCPYRDCSCSQESFLDPTAICEFISKDDIDTMKATNNHARLKAASKHNIANAFDSIPMGDTIHGIYRSTPPETMHAICAGIVPRMITNIGNGFKKKQSNSVMHNLHLLLERQHSHQSERDHPRPSPPRNHVLETTKTQATEMMGNLFLIMCSLHTQMGISVCHNAGVSSKERQGKIETMMMILALEKWLNRRNCKSDIDDKTQINAFIRTKVIPNLHKYFPRDKGMGWCFPKVHSLTKFSAFIQAFGSSINFYGGIGESHLKDYMKHYAHLTQRRRGKFAEQLANNHYQHSLFNHSLFCIRIQTKTNYVLTQQSREHTFTGLHHLTFTRKNTNTVEYTTRVQWQTESASKPLDTTLQYAILRYMATNDPSCAHFRVTAYTCAKLPTSPETLETYDAGPTHAWYKVDTTSNRFDWCMIQTHQVGSEMTDERLDAWEYLCPARIHGFVRFETGGLPTPCLLQHHDAATIRNRHVIDDTMYVIVRTHKDFLTWKELEKGFVLPIHLGNLDSCTYMLPVSRIKNPLYVFEDHGQNETANPAFFATLPARYWGFYIDHKLNSQLITGAGGLSQKCEDHTTV